MAPERDRPPTLIGGRHCSSEGSWESSPVAHHNILTDDPTAAGLQVKSLLLV